MDQTISNAVWDDPDVTISSKTAEARLDGKLWGKCGCWLLNKLFNAEDHCSGALEHDLERAEQAEEELENETKQ